MEWFDKTIEEFAIPGWTAGCFSYPLKDKPSQVEITFEN